LSGIDIEPSRLNGRIAVPPSKSVSHRAIVCAGLARGESFLENVILSEDIAATIEGMRTLGADIACWPGAAGDTAAGLPEDEGPCNLKISGSFPLSGHSSLPERRNIIDCRESGSTLRFLIPLAALTNQKITFTGRERLNQRPLSPYLDLLAGQGTCLETKGGLLPLTVSGGLRPGLFQVPGNISSQFISGLMFALPLLSGDSKIIVTTELESRGYVDLTMEILKIFGIHIDNNRYYEFDIYGGQKYKNTDYRVEGDYSQAAFWIAAGILGGGISCLDLNSASLQADREILQICRKMGAKINECDRELRVQASATRGIDIDVSQCPDLVPILAVLGALSQGTTRIINAARLRLKESDRLQALATELNKLGAKVRELADGLEIEGVETLEGGVTVRSWNDHRIAMALAVASQRCRRPIHLEGAAAVKKSYPRFWSDFTKLGGKIR